MSFYEADSSKWLEIHLLRYFEQFIHSDGESAPEVAFGYTGLIWNHQGAVITHRVAVSTNVRLS